MTLQFSQHFQLSHQFGLQQLNLTQTKGDTMEIFKDLKGREWRLQITVGTIRKVRSVLGLDLYDVSSEGFIQVIVDETEKLIDMFYLILEDQAKELGVDGQGFAEGFSGEVIDEATTAFLDELTNFFPRSKREPVKKLLAKTQKLVSIATERMMEKIDDINEKEIVDMAMANMKIPSTASSTEQQDT